MGWLDFRVGQVVFEVELWTTKDQNQGQQPDAGLSEGASSPGPRSRVLRAQGVRELTKPITCLADVIFARKNSREVNLQAVIILTKLKDENAS